MEKAIQEQKDYFKAFIKTAQHLSELTTQQDLWGEMGKALVHFFGADVSAFEEKRADGEAYGDHWTFSERFSYAGAPEAEMREATTEVFESGFFLERIIFAPDPLSVACFPITQENKVIAVMIVGYKMAGPFPRELLNTFLAVAGLVATSVTRLVLERELQGHCKQLEELARKRTAELAKANDQLRQEIVERKQAQEQLLVSEKLSILGQLAGAVGHELRNPLGIMNNAVYFLKTVLPDADDIVKEYLDIIGQELDNSLQIITDLLGFARTSLPRINTVQVDTLIRKSIDKCRIPENISVAVDIPDTLSPVNIDLLQMVQVLQNLITNAVQAMPDGGCLSIAAQQTREEKELENLSGTCPDEYVEIRIKDTGPGILRENMDKLFQPLFTTKAKEIGLGLVVCKKLVEANKGEISVESHVGEGTTIIIKIPITEGKK